MCASGGWGAPAAGDVIGKRVDVGRARCFMTNDRDGRPTVRLHTHQTRVASVSVPRPVENKRGPQTTAGGEGYGMAPAASGTDKTTARGNYSNASPYTHARSPCSRGANDDNSSGTDIILYYGTADTTLARDHTTRANLSSRQRRRRRRVLLKTP